MSPCYKSRLHIQVGWSSLQTRLHTQHNRHRALTMQTRMLGNLKLPRVFRMCPKNFQASPNCESWANENSVWRDGEFSVRTVIRRPAQVANLRTEPADERAQMQWMQAERSTKHHEHVPDIWNPPDREFRLGLRCVPGYCPFVVERRWRPVVRNNCVRCRHEKLKNPPEVPTTIFHACNAL